MTGRLTSTIRAVRERGDGAFVPFVMLGDPDMAASLRIIEQLVTAGADMLELGLPFSDPPGDGPVIQAASQRALAAGATTAVALATIQRIRERWTIPVSLLCYYNPVLQYGVDRFYRDAAVVGVDAVLVADVALDEAAPLIDAARRHGVHPVFMISELTSNERLAQIATVAEGYLYIVARVGVTGEQRSLADGLAGLLARCREHATLPLLAGFGISTPEHARTAMAAGADGVICGSAIVRRLARPDADLDRALDDVRAFTAEMKTALHRSSVDATVDASGARGI